MTRQATAQAVAFGVLGPVEAASDRGPVSLKGPRQRAVLARLLIARGRVVPVDRLVDDLWDVPPDGAIGAIRTFVSDLRRALEPDRLPRQQARLLVTAPPGYVLRAAPDAVDAWRFEAMVGESGRLLTAGLGTETLAGLDEALALWRGPAYAEVAGEIWARAEIDRLDELRLLAVERRAEALLLLGRATDAATELQAHTQGQPLREDAWQLLATALYRSGRQGEALAALRRARQTLATELGLDPGPRLRQLEADILAQAPHLRPAAVPAPAQPPPPTAPTPSKNDLPAGPIDGADRALDAGDERRPFIGRAEELGQLEQVAAMVVRHARPTLALISGDAGTGKTALAEVLTRRLAATGWTTAWGRSPEYDGAATAGPWMQIIDALTGSVSEAAEEQPGQGGAATARLEAGDPTVSRFRLRRTTLSRLATVAEQRPLLLVLDDLHRADESTLDLLTALVAQPAPVSGPVLVVGTYRATEITPELTATLARNARTEPVRVYLGGLSETATGELARAVARQPLDAPTTRLIQRRSGGNPFFVRELARLVAAEGATAVQEVPAGVRDVIRHRLSRLPDAAQTVLRQAAVIGRDFDPDVLVGLVGDEVTMLDALDAALAAGFLTEQAPGGQPRFTHILVRDTLYGDLSALRRAHWHAAVAEAIERVHPYDVAALAHHFQYAESRTTAPRAARYAHAAAEQAERRSNPREAVRLWRQAITAHDLADRRDVPGRPAAVMGLGRALAVTGQLGEARRLRAEAVTMVERLDDPQLTANVITAFAVPAIWTRNDDEHLSAQIVRAAEHALAGLGKDQLAHRSRLLSTIALELRGTTTDRGHRAAREATAIARKTADPALLAFALNARFMHTFQRPGLADARARIGTELVDLAARHKLVTFEVLGHLILLQAHGALGDLTTADAHAEAADRLADRYGLPSVSVFTRWYAALRLAVDGRLAEAEAGYRAANAQLVGGGMPGMADGLLPLALLSLSLQTSSPLAEWENWNWGPYEPWTRPLLLLAADRRGEAAAALSSVPESPHDLLWEARLCLLGRAALALDDRPTMRYVHTRLLPAANELAGAGSGVLTLGPVARHLGDLAAALRR